MNKRIEALMDQTALHRNDHTTEQRNAEIQAFAKLLINEVIHEYKACPPLLYPEYHVRKQFGVL